MNLDQLIKEAILVKDEARIRTLRFVKTEFTTWVTAKNAKPLDEMAEIKILRKMVAEREESAKLYKDAGREDLVKKETEEARILKEFLPAEISKEAISEFADSIITERGIKMMGKYVGLVKEKFPTADGKLIAEVVKSKIL